MNAKRCNRQLIIYELRNLAGNPFTAFFGIIFPCLMLMIITGAMIKDIPSSMVTEVNTQIFISISLIIPMAVVLLGHSSNYSQELEKEIPLRMKLFGFSEKSMMLAKAIAQGIAMTIGIIIYVVFSIIFITLKAPTAWGAVCLILCQYSLGILFFAFAHGVASIFKKFGPTYAITMFFYFGAMILCGMMGVATDELPKSMQYLAGMLPMSYISSDFIDVWNGQSYNFGPMIQSYLFLGAVCGILLLYVIHKNKRTIH